MSNKRYLTAWILALINVAAICNVKNFPLMAEYGFSILFFLGLASLIFFIPISLVAAELATGWPDRGLYTWVKEGLGSSWGVLAIWLQWGSNVIWYPTLLSFIGATLAYVFSPELVHNQIYMFCVVIVFFWTFTAINLLGVNVSAWISSVSAIFATILPIIGIIALGFAWAIKGYPLQIEMSWNTLIPNLSSLNHLAIFTGILLTLSGMEMSAVHAREVKHPGKDYPRAIFLSAIIIIVLSAAGALSVASVVPVQELQLAGGSMEAFRSLLAAFGMSSALPWIAALITLGALGMLSTWIAGPSRGLHAMVQEEKVLCFLKKTNERGMPTRLLILQAVLVTLLSLLFLYMPSVNASYWILVALAVELYLIAYILMFLAAIRLRYTQPSVKRAYRVPALTLIATIGIIACVFAGLMGFLQPEQVQTGSLLQYELIMILGTGGFCLIPFLILKNKTKKTNS